MYSVYQKKPGYFREDFLFLGGLKQTEKILKKNSYFCREDIIWHLIFWNQFIIFHNDKNIIVDILKYSLLV